MATDISTRIDTAKQRARTRLRQLAPELVRISKEIHAHPELAYEEHYAYGAARAVRARAGVRRARAGVRHGDSVPRRVGQRRADDRRSAPSTTRCRRSGTRADTTSSRTAGVGAAAALIGGARPGDARIVVLGTPAEEGNGGKIRMIDGGCFDDIDVRDDGAPAPIDIAEAPMFGVAHVDVEYRGKAVHASVFPEQGINALDALVTAYQAIAQLRQHIRRDARIHGIITNGGEAANVVPHVRKRRVLRARAQAVVPGATEGARQGLLRGGRAGDRLRAVDGLARGRRVRADEEQPRRWSRPTAATARRSACSSSS